MSDTRSEANFEANCPNCLRPAVKVSENRDNTYVQYECGATGSFSTRNRSSSIGYPHCKTRRLRPGNTTHRAWGVGFGRGLEREPEGGWIDRIAEAPNA